MRTDRPAAVPPLMMKTLILASSSPRRAELLRSAGFTFSAMAVDVDETPLPAETASDYVLRVARAKAHAVASTAQAGGAIILAADTAVVTGSRIMGKPRDAEDAASMLAALSGAVHEVLTGVVVKAERRELVDLVTTRVHFLRLSPADVAWYSPPVSRKERPAPTRFRAAPRGSSTGLKVPGRTWSGCRWRRSTGC